MPANDLHHLNKSCLRRRRSKTVSAVLHAVQDQVWTLLYWSLFKDGCDPQKVQTVQSWLANSSSAFVDAKAPDHTLAWAHFTLTTTLHKNLEEPDRYFQNYGDGNIGPYFCGQSKSSAKHGVTAQGWSFLSFGIFIEARSWKQAIASLWQWTKLIFLPGQWIAAPLIPFKFSAREAHGLCGRSINGVSGVHEDRCAQSTFITTLTARSSFIKLATVKRAHGESLPPLIGRGAFKNILMTIWIIIIMCSNNWFQWWFLRVLWTLFLYLWMKCDNIRHTFAALTICMPAIRLEPAFSRHKDYNAYCHQIVRCAWEV